MDRPIASIILALFIIAPHSRSSETHRIVLAHQDLVRLGTKLISIFKNQRTLPSKNKEKSHHQQFSVVYLASSKEGVLEFPDMTDNRKDVHYRSNFSFITARVHNGKHAEQLMMEKFKQLKNAYKEPVEFIIFYSWLLPCQDCCNSIISKIKECFPQKLPETVLLYSRVWPEESKCKKDTMNCFRTKGIHVKLVESKNV